MIDPIHGVAPEISVLIERLIAQDRLITGHSPEQDIRAMEAAEEAFEMEYERRRTLRLDAYKRRKALMKRMASQR